MKSDLSFGLLNKAQNLHAVILCRKNLARNQKPETKTIELFVLFLFMGHRNVLP